MFNNDWARLLYIFIRLLEERLHLLVRGSGRNTTSLKLLHEKEPIFNGLDHGLGSVDLHVGHPFLVGCEEIFDLVVGSDDENSVKEWDCSTFDLTTALVLVSPDLEIVAELVGVTGVLVQIFNDDDLLSLVAVEPFASCHDERLLSEHLDGLFSGCVGLT